MAAIPKHIIHVKHNFKQYNIRNDTYSLCLCEIFTINFAKRRRKSPGLEMLENGSDVVTEIRFSKQETTSLEMSIYMDVQNVTFRKTS